MLPPGPDLVHDSRQPQIGALPRLPQYAGSQDAGLSRIAHRLSVPPHEEIPSEDIALPERVFNPDYERRTLAADLYVPQKY
jgi:hypothetical protein